MRPRPMAWRRQQKARSPRHEHGGDVLKGTGTQFNVILGHTVGVGSVGDERLQDMDQLVEVRGETFTTGKSGGTDSRNDGSLQSGRVCGLQHAEQFLHQWSHVLGNGVMAHELNDTVQ